jgi:acyl carrier protein
MQEVAQDVRRFVVDNFLFGEGDGQFSNQDSFLDKGLIDSMGILTLVEFVKEKYAIPVEDEDLTPDNWDSVQRIANFVQAKLAMKN